MKPKKFYQRSYISDKQIENILEASWINGVSAQVLMDILTKTEQSIEEAQHFCNYFNWQKLQEEIAKRTNTSIVDRKKLSTKLQVLFLFP